MGIGLEFSHLIWSQTACLTVEGSFHPVAAFCLFSFLCAITSFGSQQAPMGEGTPKDWLTDAPPTESLGLLRRAEWKHANDVNRRDPWGVSVCGESGLSDWNPPFFVPNTCRSSLAYFHVSTIIKSNELSMTVVELIFFFPPPYTANIHEELWKKSSQQKCWTCHK